VKLILGALAWQTHSASDLLPLHLGEVQRLCNVSPATATKLVRAVEATSIVHLDRLNGRMIRARWNLEHPLVARALIRTSVRPVPRPVPSAIDTAPLESADVELLELLGRAVARERARRLGLPVLATSLLPPPGEGRVIARWMREQSAGLAIGVEDLAARVAAAYVANDGNNGSLRACGWRLVWLPRELDRISARLAKRAVPVSPVPPVVESSSAPPAVPPRDRVQQMGQFAEMAKRAIAGASS